MEIRYVMCGLILAFPMFAWGEPVTCEIARLEAEAIAALRDVDEAEGVLRARTALADLNEQARPCAVGRALILRALSANLQ